MAENYERLAMLTRARRKELGLSQLEVGDRGGPSNTMLTRIENARLTGGLSRSTRRKLESALEWGVGSVDQILEGGSPDLTSDNVVPDTFRPPGLYFSSREADRANKRWDQRVRRMSFDDLYYEWTELEHLKFVLESVYADKRGITVAEARAELFRARSEEPLEWDQYSNWRPPWFGQDPLPGDENLRKVHQPYIVVEFPGTPPDVTPSPSTEALNNEGQQDGDDGSRTEQAGDNSDQPAVVGPDATGEALTAAEGASAELINDTNPDSAESNIKASPETETPEPGASVR